MKRPTKKVLVAAFAIAVALAPAAKVSAVDIALPAAALLIPDICGSFLGSGTCIQYTHATELVQIEQLLGVIQNLQHAGNIQNTISIVRGEVPAMEAAVASVEPTHAKDAAAATANEQIPDVDDQLTAAGNTIANCDGDLCAASANGAQATTSASELHKANVLTINGVKAEDAAQIGFAKSMVEEFGPGAAMPDELQ